MDCPRGISEGVALGDGPDAADLVEACVAARAERRTEPCWLRGQRLTDLVLGMTTAQLELSALVTAQLATHWTGMRSDATHAQLTS